MEDKQTASFGGEQWLHELFDHAKDLIQIVHIDGTILYVNQAWATLLQYNKEEILGQSLYTYITKEDQSLYRRYRDEVLNGKQAEKQLTFRLVTKHGELISVEGNISIKTEGDKPLYTRGIFRDMTQRLQNEARLHQLNQVLKEREDNLRQLLMQAPDAVIVISKESRILFWNPKAEQLFGWRSDEVLHQLLQHYIIPLHYREAHERGMQRYLATGEGRVLNKTIEITALKKSGQEFYVALTISPTAQNGETAFIAFIRDITEQRNNQLALERKTRELEQFTHVSHHDLQEPLRKITMLTEMVRAEAADKLSMGAQQRLEKVSSAAQRMSAALRDLLNFASLDKEEQASEVDLEEILAAVLVDLELVIAEKKARITISPLPLVTAIPHHMHQLFYNLLNNALKFARPDIAPVVSITLQNVAGSAIAQQGDVDQQRRYYHIAVKDNGIGFSQEAAEKIFGMFQRLHSRETFAGTGIGLALAKKVVENHNGFIWAESNPGEGAIFHVLLPVV